MGVAWEWRGARANVGDARGPGLADGGRQTGLDEEGWRVEGGKRENEPKE